MSAEYSTVKGGKLRLKGGAGAKLRKKNKRKRSDTSKGQEYAEGELKHGARTWVTTLATLFVLNVDYL